MKKIKRRAMSAAIVALLVVTGLFVYLLRYVNDGTDWALSVINRNLYVDGVLNSGTIRDRNDMLLASTENGLVYAEDSAVRTSCLHIVGDFSGNIGSSVLNAFADTLTRYNLITGAYSFRDVEETVVLSIDSALNVTAYNALNGRKGAVVVMNYKTGEVLCMVSSTSYDPMNKPADLSGDYYDGVYLNRAIHVTYPPGSVFKIITLTAALEEINNISEQTFTCSGSMDIDGNTVVCEFDLSAVDRSELALKVDIGAAAYWSEVMQLQTLDNLFEKGIIPDAVSYLESIPSSYIRGKNKLIEKVKKAGAGAEA